MNVGNCRSCGESFMNIKKHAKGMCARCYRNEYYKDYYRKNFSKKKKHPNCLSCNISLIDGKDKKGKDITSVKGYCRYCYSKLYRVAACKECEKCGAKFRTANIQCICDLCKQERPPDVAKKRKAKKGDIIMRKDVSKENLAMMLTLFRRYKNGTQNMVDHFRVANLYLEVFEGHPFVYNSTLDSYNEESQVVLMLRQLKNVYDNV